MWCAHGHRVLLGAEAPCASELYLSTHLLCVHCTSGWAGRALGASACGRARTTGRCVDGMGAADALRDKLAARSAVVGVLGLGYVGLPLCACVHRAGFRVLGFDIDRDKIDKLQRAQSYIVYIPQDTWDKLSQSAQFEPTDDFERLREVDVFVICLPTPVGPHNEPDLQYVFGAVQTIAAKMKPGSLVILESTTYPGTTDTDVVALLRDNVGAAWLTERTAPVLGENFFVAFSPEREDPANQMFAYETIPKLVGGVCATSGALAAEFYKQAGFATPVLVESARVAECAKLVENIYRSVNIALVNELKVVFEAMDVNIWSVLDAAQTKPFGFHRFNPGPGVGGHCIGVDPFYLSWKAKEFGQNCDFVQLAARVNASMPDFVVGRVAAALNELGRALNGSRVLLIGVAFKADVDDMRGSPSLEVWERLRKGGALVSYYDPMISVIPPTREHRLLMGQESVTWNRESIDGHDCLVLLTNHSQIDYSILKSYSGVVVDTRNAVPKDLDIRVVQA